MRGWVRRGSVDLSQMADLESNTLKGLSDSDLYAFVSGWKDGTPQWIAGQVELSRRENATARWAVAVSTMSLIVSIAALALSACSSPPSAASKTATEAQAIAQVERLSQPPAIPIRPQPITFADLEKYDLFGVGCYFLDGIGEKAPMLFIGHDDKG